MSGRIDDYGDGREERGEIRQERECLAKVKNQKEGSYDPRAWAAVPFMSLSIMTAAINPKLFMRRCVCPGRKREVAAGTSAGPRCIAQYALSECRQTFLIGAWQAEGAPCRGTCPCRGRQSSRYRHLSPTRNKEGRKASRGQEVGRLACFFSAQGMPPPRTCAPACLRRRAPFTSLGQTRGRHDHPVRHPVHPVHLPQSASLITLFLAARGGRMPATAQQPSEPGLPHFTTNIPNLR